jgi:hypothetical protein
MKEFEDYWKEFGKYHHEVISNPAELEEDFYNLCKKIWRESVGTKQENYNIGYTEGWDACKNNYEKNN